MATMMSSRLMPCCHTQKRPWPRSRLTRSYGRPGLRYTLPCPALPARPESTRGLPSYWCPFFGRIDRVCSSAHSLERLPCSCPGRTRYWVPILSRIMSGSVSFGMCHKSGLGRGRAGNSFRKLEHSIAGNGQSRRAPVRVSLLNEPMVHGHLIIYVSRHGSSWVDTISPRRSTAGLWPPPPSQRAHPSNSNTCAPEASPPPRLALSGVPSQSQRSPLSAAVLTHSWHRVITSSSP